MTTSSPSPRYAATIEWASDAGEAPALIVGHTEEAVAAKVVVTLRDALPDDAYADEPGFLTEHPYPDTTDPEAVQDWLEEMREATTAPWVEVFTLPPTESAELADGYPLRRQYRDLSAAPRPY